MNEPNIIWQIFNGQNALLAFFGALGGAVRSAALQTTYKEGLRVVFIGGATAFGVGTLAPYLLRPWIGDLPTGAGASLGGLCSASFVLGLVAVTLIERWIEGPEADGE